MMVVTGAGVAPSEKEYVSLFREETRKPIVLACVFLGRASSETGASGLTVLCR